ncbi:MAG TPA: CRISPR-associated endonuclease Cas2 [Candidatus Paceibacterota bacterium]
MSKNKIEKLLADEESRTSIKRVILGTIGVAGLLTMMAVVPNALQALTLFGVGKRKYNPRYHIQKTLQKLLDRGLVKLERNNQGINCVRLTERGQIELQKYELSKLVIKKPKHWDGKYHLIIFDIKEWKRGTRNQLRTWLEHLGFIRLQNSVWAYPYECREVITLLKSFFHLGKEVLYIIADQIENDQWLRREFGL